MLGHCKSNFQAPYLLAQVLFCVWSWEAWVGHVAYVGAPEAELSRQLSPRPSYRGFSLFSNHWVPLELPLHIAPATLYNYITQVMYCPILFLWLLPMLNKAACHQAQYLFWSPDVHRISYTSHLPNLFIHESGWPHCAAVVAAPNTEAVTSVPPSIYPCLLQCCPTPDAPVSRSNSL